MIPKPREGRVIAVKKFGNRMSMTPNLLEKITDNIRNYLSVRMKDKNQLQKKRLQKL